MSVYFVVAWRDLGCRDRLAAFKYVAGFYAALLDEIPGVFILAAAEPFSKTRALNQAISELESDAIIVQSDADAFVPDPAAYREAIRLAAEAPGLVVPHTYAIYLTPEATAKVLANNYNLGPKGGEVVPASVGCVTVFSRQTWALAGGYDERFGLWGGDDAAFAYACGALAGEQRRLGGDVLHLHHPRPAASMPGTPGYLRQAVILDQYRDAEAEGPDALRALLASRG